LPCAIKLLELTLLNQVLPLGNATSRYPGLIGQMGYIEAGPEYPSSWLSVRLDCGKLIKLQPPSMRLIGRTPERDNYIARYTPNNCSPVGARSRNELDSELGPSVSGLLLLGSAVVIVSTDNVQQRAPQRVGERGIIKEVPVHPITWFKVEFEDGKVLAFRLSALLPAGESTATSSRSKPYIPLHKIFRQEAGIASDKRGVEADTFVRIIKGKQMGETGRVIKSGNGWVQLGTAAGEVAKRMHEVEAINKPPFPKDTPLTDKPCVSSVVLPSDLDAVELVRRLRSDSAFTDNEVCSPELSSLEPSANFDKSTDFCGEFDSGDDADFRGYKRMRVSDIAEDDWALPPPGATTSLGTTSVSSPVRLPTLLSQLEDIQWRNS
jgi:hypothetical protein